MTSSSIFTASGRVETISPLSTRGIVLSLLLHLLLATLLFHSLEYGKRPQHITQVIEVELAPPNITRQRQIVSPSEAGLEREPEKAFVSDTSRQAEKEQLQRGQEESAPQIGRSRENTAEQIAKPAEARPTPRSARPKQQIAKAPAPERTIKQLLLDDATTQERFSAKEQPEQTQEEDRSYQPFSRAQGSGALFLGKTGSSDFLPDLPDGDLTMLNTKASHFAVFVRRVATRIFGQMRMQGWDSITHQELARLGEFVHAEAIMSLKGELVSAAITQSSGSERFDRLLLQSIKAGLADQNPPPGAAFSDGQIHFIFQSRSWSKLVGTRQGGVSERRWLLLGTGLR